MACHPLATGGHTVPISSPRASFSSPDDDGRAVSIRAPVGYGRAVTHRHDAARSPPAGCGSPENIAGDRGSAALARSYATPRGRTFRRRVVPKLARSYLRALPTYDRAYPGTTPWKAVRPRAQRALHGDDGRVPVGIPAPARSGPPCAHRAHGPPRRVTGASPAQRQRGVMSRIRIGRDSPGGGMAHWWLGHRGSAPSESRSTSRAPRRPSAPPDNDTALSTKNATRNKDAPPLRGSVLRGRPPPRSGRRRSPCRSSRRAPPRDGRPAADTSPGSAPPDTCDADL